MVLDPVKDGSDSQSIFFDMWRQEHPDADLQDIPKRSGHRFRADQQITLQNALYQLDRQNALAPFNGFVGEKLSYVLCTSNCASFTGKYPGGSPKLGNYGKE
jgi:hypothetical protein